MISKVVCNCMQLVVLIKLIVSEEFLCKSEVACYPEMDNNIPQWVMFFFFLNRGLVPTASAKPCTCSTVVCIA